MHLTYSTPISLFFPLSLSLSLSPDRDSRQHRLAHGLASRPAATAAELRPGGRLQFAASAAVAAAVASCCFNALPRGAAVRAWLPEGQERPSQLSARHGVGERGRGSESSASGCGPLRVCGVMLL